MSGHARATWDQAYHVGRLLILLDAYARAHGRPLFGLTKLAKLDFLLRYPVALETLVGSDATLMTAPILPTEAERGAVEARMVRHRYGPFDTAYYRLFGALAGRGLVDVHADGSGWTFHVTELGSDRARSLSLTEEWALTTARADEIVKRFDVTGNRLKELVYLTFPEIVDQPHRTEI